MQRSQGAISRVAILKAMVTAILHYCLIKLWKLILQTQPHFAQIVPHYMP